MYYVHNVLTKSLCCVFHWHEIDGDRILDKLVQVNFHFPRRVILILPNHYLPLHYITLHYITLHYITLHNITWLTIKSLYVTIPAIRKLYTRCLRRKLKTKELHSLGEYKIIRWHRFVLISWICQTSNNSKWQIWPILIFPSHFPLILGDQQHSH